MHDTEAGRAAQRRRTRQAIVDATAALLDGGAPPSVREIADRAGVSRRTVYMYFPTLEQLLIDASLVPLTRETVDAALDALDALGAGADVEARVEALTRAVHQTFGAAEARGRTLMRLTIDARGRAGGDAARPVRGYRRVGWIERALAPLRGALDDARFERLVSALALVIGWEAIIVERDVRALSLDEAEETSVWAARALVRAARDEARLSPPGGA